MDYHQPVIHSFNSPQQTHNSFFLFLPALLRNNNSLTFIQNQSRHRAIIDVAPLPLATSATVLRFVFAIGFVIMFTLNIAFRAPFFPSFRFRNGRLALVEFVTEESQ